MNNPIAQNLLPRQTGATIQETLKAKKSVALAVILATAIAIYTLTGQGNLSIPEIVAGTTAGAVALLGTSLILYRACSLLRKIQKIEHLLQEANNGDDLSKKAITQFYEACLLLDSLPQGSHSDRLDALRDRTKEALRNKIGPTFARLATGSTSTQRYALSAIFDALRSEEIAAYRIIDNHTATSRQFYAANGQINRNMQRGGGEFMGSIANNGWGTAPRGIVANTRLGIL